MLGTVRHLLIRLCDHILPTPTHTHGTKVLIPQPQKDFGRPDKTTDVLSNSFPYISQAKGVLFFSI